MNKANRLKRIFQAQSTLEIIEKGQYLSNGNTINIKSEVENSIDKTFTIAPDDWDKMLATIGKAGGPRFDTTIESKNCTTIEALLSENTDSRIGILNFASAKNPGGGFLTGAMAQEESLARSSSLYACQTKDNTMYSHNRHANTYLYSDYMIYSPDVVFWMDDAGHLLEKPVLADVITSPAPNRGAMLQNRRSDELPKIAPVLQSRMEKVLAIAQLQGVEVLILGAWGCGVFRNEPAEVAALFHQTIESGFQNIFKKIVFAVLDTSEKQSNFNAFRK